MRELDLSILQKVNFIGQPGKHQERGIALGLCNNEQALFWEPGAGKTYAAVHVAKTRYQWGNIDLLVVICPNAIRQVWPSEFKKWSADSPFWFQMMESGAMLARQRKPGLEVLVVSVEALSQGQAFEKIMNYVKGRKFMTIMDESSRIKNPSSARTKNATAIAWSGWYRMILTGTPILQGPVDLFAQMRFLNPDIIGIKKWAAFRAKYCIMGGFQNRQITSYNNVEELIGKIAPYADMVRLIDCTDIPSKIYQRIDVPLSKEQQDAINMLKHENLLVIEELGIDLAVEMALERMTRIQQIVGGSLPYMDEESGKYKTMPLQGRIPKLDALLEYASDLPQGTKCLVWARFAPERERLEAALVEAYGREAVVRFDGTTNAEDRVKAVTRMQEDPECLFFVGNQAVAGIGLTLTAAKYALNYSNTFSAEDRVQMENRNHRTGQEEHCIYVDFVAKVKEDRMIMRALALKQSLSEMVKDSLHRGNNPDMEEDNE